MSANFLILSDTLLFTFFFFFFFFGGGGGGGGGAFRGNFYGILDSTNKFKLRHFFNQCIPRLIRWVD